MCPHGESLIVGKFAGRAYIWGLAVFIAVDMVVALLLAPKRTPQPRTLPPQELPYSAFLSKAETGQVSLVTVTNESVSGQLKDGRAFHAYVPADDPSYIGVLEAKGVAITVVPQSQSSLWSNLLTVMLPIILARRVLAVHDAACPVRAEPGHGVRQDQGTAPHRGQGPGDVR